MSPHRAPAVLLAAALSLPVAAHPARPPRGAPSLSPPAETAPDWRDLVHRTRDLALSGRPDEARRLLQEIRDAGPEAAPLAWHLLGELELLEARPRAAAEAFTRALELRPGDGEALVGRAKARLWLEDDQTALADLEAAAAVPLTAPEASYLAAAALALLDRTDAAGDLARRGIPPASPWSPLRAALDQDPGAGARLPAAIGSNLLRPSSYLALGLFRWRSGEPGPAADALRIAAAMDPTDPLAARLLRRAAPGLAPAPRPDFEFATAVAAADAAFRARDWAAVRETARRLVERRPYFLPAWLLEIGAAERQGDLWSALAAHRTLLGWLPEVPPLLAGLARTARRMGAHDLQACALGRALAIESEDAAIQADLAYALAAAGRPGEALSALERAFDLGLVSSDGYRLQGDLLYQTMDIAGSIAAYGRALALEPDAAEEIASFALAHLTADESEALHRLLERHAAAHPGNVNTLYSLGVLELRQGDLAAAGEIFERLARLAPRHAEVHYNLALVRRRRGEQAAGDAAFARFRELKAAEDEEWLRRNRAHARRLAAADLAAAGRAAEAAAIYRELERDGLADREDRLALGRTLLASGDAAAALTTLEALLAERPYDPEPIDVLAATLERLGREREAAAWRERRSLLADACGGAPTGREAE